MNELAIMLEEEGLGLVIVVRVWESNSKKFLKTLELRMHSILFKSLTYCWSAFLRSSMKAGFLFWAENPASFVELIIARELSGNFNPENYVARAWWSSQKFLIRKIEMIRISVFIHQRLLCIF